MRILHVIPGLEEATFVFAKRQAASLQKMGTECRTYHLGFCRSPARVLSEVRRLRQAIRAFQPDVIHPHYGGITALLCAVTTTRPLVITFQGSDLNPVPSERSLRPALGHLFSHLATLRARHIVCVSRQLKERLWWRKSRASVISSGVNMEIFYPRPREEARLALGWPCDDRVVLFNAGRYPKIKRLDLAEEAVEAARKLIGPVRFFVLSGNFAPEAVPLAMSGADCLLVTSDWEGSPNFVKEALACNLPIVSVPVGDVPERLEHTTPSRIVDRDPAKLGAAIAEILELGRRSNGRENMLELDEDVVAERIRSIYDSATGGRQSDGWLQPSKSSARPQAR